MKSSSVRLGVILFIIGLIIFSNIEIWGADWKLFRNTEETIEFYDTQSVSFSSENILKVHVKFEFTDKGLFDMVKKFGKSFEHLNHQISIEEINCADKTFRLLSVAYYSRRGRVLLATINKPEKTSWRSLRINSHTEALSKELCK